MATIFGLTHEDSLTNRENWRHQNLERARDWCSDVGKVAFNNNFINPVLVLEPENMDSPATVEPIEQVEFS